MSSYCGKDYFEAAFARERLDRVSVAVLCSFVPFLPEVGLTPKDLRIDPSKFVKAMVHVEEVIPSDAISLIVGDETLTAEALGEEVGFTREKLVALSRERVHLLEDKSFLANFKLPNLKQGPRLPYYMEICQLAASQLEETAVLPFLPSPWSTAMGWRGIEELIFDTQDDSDFVSQLLRFTTDYAKMVGEAVLETGIGYAVIAEPSASCSVISPWMFREWVKPHMMEAVDYLRGLQKGKVILHICGYVDPIMEDLVEIGFDGLSIDSPSSLQRMVDISQNRVAIIGNTPTEMFLRGTREQIEEAVKEGIATAAEGNGYILCSGCQVPEPAPLENVHSYLEAAHRYGRYN